MDSKATCRATLEIFVNGLESELHRATEVMAEDTDEESIGIVLARVARAVCDGGNIISLDTVLAHMLFNLRNEVGDGSGCVPQLASIAEAWIEWDGQLPRFSDRVSVTFPDVAVAAST